MPSRSEPMAPAIFLMARLYGLMAHRAFLAIGHDRSDVAVHAKVHQIIPHRVPPLVTMAFHPQSGKSVRMQPLGVSAAARSSKNASDTYDS
jgi:hypothetical protein